MDDLPLLVIEVSATRVRATFADPATGVPGNPVEAPFALPAGLPRVDVDPDEHGKQLTAALLDAPGMQGVRDVMVQALRATVRATPDRPLRIRLALPADDPQLHQLGWEALRDPIDGQPLLLRTRIYFSRYLSSDESAAPPPLNPRALIVIANPPALADSATAGQVGGVALKEVRVDEEEERAVRGLGSIPKDVIRSEDGVAGKASLKAVLERLGDENEPACHILYLVCHGGIKNGVPLLWTDEPDGKTVEAQRLVDGLRALAPARRPRLIVLASCQSAGQLASATVPVMQRGLIASLGPKLVHEAGIAAVVAMRGDVLQAGVASMMPRFFRQLENTGQVEAATAAGRAPLAAETNEFVRDQWWAPVLFSRLDRGYLWPPRRIQGHTVYLSHAIGPDEPEAAALASTREILDLGGFTIIESAESPPEPSAVATPQETAAAAAERAGWWSRRLLDGLGTCDGAVLLLNRRAVTEPHNWVKTEADILYWRNWLEKGFRLIVICTGSAVPRPDTAPWSLLWELGASDLAGATPADQEAELRALLRPLEALQTTANPSRWGLTDLQRRVFSHFKQIGLDDVLLASAQELEKEFGPAGSDEEAASRWARAALCGGPAVVTRLYSGLGNLVTQQVKNAVREILGAVQPAWVPIDAAARMVYLAAHADRQPGAFYLQGIEPFDWVVQCYAARASSRALDLLENPPTHLLVVVVPAGALPDAERLSSIRLALRERLDRSDPALWQTCWNRAGGGQAEDPNALFFGHGELAPPDDARVEAAIKLFVETRAVQKQPVLLLLSGETATRTQLLADVRQRFGPVIFFFMGRAPAPTGAGLDFSLVCDLPAAAGTAFSERTKLNNILST